jgi:hypothetical protein
MAGASCCAQASPGVGLGHPLQEIEEIRGEARQMLLELQAQPLAGHVLRLDAPGHCYDGHAEAVKVRGRRRLAVELLQSHVAKRSGDRRPAVTQEIPDTPEVDLSLLADASGNDNSRGKPSGSYTSDFYLGLKLGWAMGRLLHLGFHGAAVILAGTGDLPFSSRSTSFLARAIATLELHGLASSFPLRIHLNAGAIVDNSDVPVQPAFDSIERYALRLN